MGRKLSGWKDFALLFLGQTLSQFGSAMTGFAVIIWAYTEKGQVMASSLLGICSAIPYLIVSIAGGAVVDRGNKKKIMLICDFAAALGSMAIFLCFYRGILQLWVLCAVNILSGFMNAFQKPASQVAVSLLIEKQDYAKAGGIQSVVEAAVSIVTPVLAAAALSVGGLGLVLWVDLATFFLAFFSLLFFVKIPEISQKEKKTSAVQLREDMLAGVRFLRQERGIFLLLLLYSILEFAGAISFDSMYSPLLLARTGNHEMVVGVVSSFMAAGCLAASILISVRKPPRKKLPAMYAGSFLCLLGIMLFGMGRNLYWWCAVVFCGCFGAPVYQTYQTVILRERVPVDMQGRIFSMQGMITGMLTPMGYFLGAVLADDWLEPFMQRKSGVQQVLSVFVGEGKGAGIGVIFVFAGLFGIVLLGMIGRNRSIKALDED